MFNIFGLKNMLTPISNLVIDIANNGLEAIEKVEIANSIND